MAIIGGYKKPERVKKTQSLNRPEHAIFKVAASKLKDLGWKVVAELPFPFSYAFVDGGAKKGDEYLLIEAKVRFSKQLQHQLNLAMIGTPYTLGVIGKKPKANNEMMVWADKVGVGIWLVQGEVVEQLLQPKNHFPVTSENYRNRFEGMIDNWEENHDGGKPTEKGVGPAIKCNERVKEYRLMHPKAKWKDIFENVPNHYSNHRSMACALRFFS